MRGSGLCASERVLLTPHPTQTWHVHVHLSAAASAADSFLPPRKHNHFNQEDAEALLIARYQLHCPSSDPFPHCLINL